MKSLAEYINEKYIDIEGLISEAKYCADCICVSLAFIDIYKSMIEGDDEKTLDLMYDVSGSVAEYNYSIPKAITKYAQSTTNVTVDDWIESVKTDIFNTQSRKYVEELIIKDDKNDFAYLRTSFSKSALKRILDLYKEHCDNKVLKNLIAREKKTILNYKQKFNDYKKSMN